MSQVLIIIILVILVILVGLIGLYLSGFFGSSQKNPSDLHPFVDFAEIIEPSLLPEAKKDYNKIILKVFEIINSQPYLLDDNSEKLFGPIMQSQMAPIFAELSKKYTPAVGAKLFKYFVLKHLTVILDNYYTGPPIKIDIPLSLVPLNMPFLQNGPMKDFVYELIPFHFEYTSKVTSKRANASTLAPYKYFVYNIPKDIRDEVAHLYDNIVDRYIGIFNNVVAPLTEVNLDTIKTLNLGPVFLQVGPLIQEDIAKIQKLVGENLPRFIIKAYNENILPFLTNYYKGPGIFTGGPLFLPLPAGPQKVNIIYPNKPFNMRPKCLPYQVTKVVNGVKTCVDVNVALKEYTDSHPVTSPVLTSSPALSIPSSSVPSIAPSVTFPTPTTVAPTTAAPSVTFPTPTTATPSISTPVITTAASTPVLSSTAISSPSSSSSSSSSARKLL
jgi:hypothetical protein